MKSKVLKWIIALTATALVALAVRAWIVTPVRVAGASMEPALTHGDIALVTKFDYLHASPERGDIVLCTLPNRSGSYIKRVIGLPGDTIELTGGRTYINGELQNEAYATPAEEDYTITLPENRYLVLGDNRPESYDSRQEDIGSLASDCFLGRVRFVLWPISRFGGI